MEKAQNVWVNCTDFGWSDIGTWSALYQYSQKDRDGNVSTTDSVLFNTKNCIIKASEGKLVLIDGLKDYIIVEKDNVLMICPRSSEQTIKAYIDEVKFKYGEEFI
jgi:mannose-1-phosphate guanylyltransferase